MWSSSKSHLNFFLHTCTVKIELIRISYIGTVVLEMITISMVTVMAILLFGVWSPLCNIFPEKVLDMQGNPVIHQDTGHHQSPKYNHLRRRRMDAGTECITESFKLISLYSNNSQNDIIIY